MGQRHRGAPSKRAPPNGAAADGKARSPLFDPPVDDHDRRQQLTRERVVAEALTIIAHHGIHALTMRRLATRLGVVPGALYHHVRNKQQLHDLVLDNVLAEIDLHQDPTLAWTDQLNTLAHRLRQVLEAHPGVAGILKTRDPLGPHSLALAEAFLAPLQAAGFADHDAGLAFFLLVDYTMVALGEHVWVDNRDHRFTAAFGVVIRQGWGGWAIPSLQVTQLGRGPSRRGTDGGRSSVAGRRSGSSGGTPGWRHRRSAGRSRSSRPG